MTTPAQVLDIARAKLGIGETPAGSNRNQFTEWYGMTGPWCAMWVSFVFATAGLPLPATTSKGFAYCPSGIAWFERNRRWKTGDPQPGDVVFFRFPGEAAGRSNHVGIVEKVTGPNTIQTIEGNTQDRVMRRARSTSTVVGYGSPEWRQPASVAPPGAQTHPLAAVIPTVSGQGYWLIHDDGGVFTYGDAQFFGSMGGQHLNAPIVDAAVHPSGNGYWLVGADGGVFGFGSALFHGSIGNHPLNKPVRSIASTPSGNGYWLAAEDRGVFAFGDAGFFGSGS